MSEDGFEILQYKQLKPVRSLVLKTIRLAIFAFKRNRTLTLNLRTLALNLGYEMIFDLFLEFFEKLAHHGNFWIVLQLIWYTLCPVMSARPL